jgi:uncharacterized surface protein with fasciclin (FAS1) repeats
MKRFWKPFLLILAAGMVTLSSCKKDDDDEDPVADTPAQQQTIAGLASSNSNSNSNLSILTRALERADLVNTLNGSAQYTVFAPTNDAFIAAGYTLDVINGLSDADVDNVLTPILLNHVLSGEVKAAQVTTGYVSTLSEGGADVDNAAYSMYISTASGVVINGGPTVVTADVDASNGVVHVVDEVILLPTIATFVAADPNLSTLLAAAQLAELDDELADEEYGPVTVFAPNNTAFTNSGINLITTSQGDAASVILGHLVTGNVRSTELSDGQPVATNNTAVDLTVNISGSSVTLDVDGGTSGIGVTAFDIQAQNGVVHVVDEVILAPAP